MIQKYEILYIVPAQYSDDELGPVKEKVSAVIEKAGGKITREDNLGKKKLAYPIKKFHQGYYLLSEFDLDQKNLEELNTSLRLTDEIIRHLITKSTPRTQATYEITKKRMEQEALAVKTTAETEKAKQEDEKDKVKLEDLDKKLDEILETDNLL